MQCESDAQLTGVFGVREDRQVKPGVVGCCLKQAVSYPIVAMTCAARTSKDIKYSLN